jgi:ribulose-phosphate 3-epimerase
MTKIAPSILSADFLRLGEEVKAAEEAGADVIHVDVMDGRFVPNITIGPPVVAAVKKATSLPLDVHLMIAEPEKYIEEFVKAGSINPSTPVSTLEDVIEDLDLVLIMSVNPGFGGQAFIPRALDKLRLVGEMIKARGIKNPPEIEIDGGIKPDNARQAVDAGATMLVMGSAFYGSGDYKALVKKVRENLGE